MAFLNKNKKGQTVFDLILLVIVIFVVALAAVFGAYVYDELNDEIQNDADFSAQSKESAEYVNTNYATWFDNIILTILIMSMTRCCLANVSPLLIPEDWLGR